MLGKGKGGYSYLVTDGVTLYVLKQIHHEPCAYYQFGNKLESEINDYNRLCAIGIKLPKFSHMIFNTEVRSNLKNTYHMDTYTDVSYKN